MSHEAPPSAPKELWLRDLSDEEFFKDADGKKSLYEVGKVRGLRARCKQIAGMAGNDGWSLQFPKRTPCCCRVSANAGSI